jgi:hypothetical protein
MTKKSQQLNILSANINGLRGKFDKLCSEIDTFKPSVFCIQETKICDKVIEQFVIPGYHLFRADRNQNGGGVAIYVHSSLNATRIELTNPEFFELIAVSIRVGSEKLAILSTYRPPNQSPNDYVNNLTSALSIINASCEKIALLGDCNLCHNHTESTELIASMAAFDCRQLITNITHKKRLIDIIYITNSINILSAEILPPVENYHASTSVSFEIPIIHQPVVKRECWVYAKGDWARFCNLLVSYNLVNIVGEGFDVESIWGTFKDIVLKCAGICIPRRILKVNSSLGWCNNTLRNLIRKKRVAYQLWKHSSSEIDRHRFVKLRKRCNKAIATAKRNFYFESFCSLSNIAQFWQKYRAIITPKSDSVCIVSSDGLPVTREQMANELANQFASVMIRDESQKEKVQKDQDENEIQNVQNGQKGQKDPTRESDNQKEIQNVQKGQKGQKDPTRESDNQKEKTAGKNEKIPELYEKIKNKEDIPLNWLCDVDFVRSSVADMSNSKSPGIDKLTVPMYKNAIDVIAPFIAVFINMIIWVCEIPSEWKSAIIVAVPKITIPVVAADFRPISLLCNIEKVFELHLLELLKPFIVPKISDCQFGFLKGRATTDALMYLDYLLAQGLSLSPSVAAVFFDIKKAFDTVSHSLLLEILHEEYGVPSHLCRLLQNYLSGRVQNVRFGGFYSEFHDVISGVPQGSVLGPVLFIALINSLNRVVLSINCKFILFADDLVIVKPMLSTSSQAELQRDVTAINTHISTTLRLAINSVKTKLMLFKRCSRSPCPELNLTVNNELIALVTEHKYLGITFDEQFSYKPHYTKTVCSVKRATGVMARRFRKCLPPSVLKYLFTVLMRSVLLYGIEAWYPPTKYGRSLIERCQKFATRCIMNNFDYNVEYSCLLSTSSLQPIYRVVFSKRIVLIHRYVSGTRHIPAECIKPMISIGSRRSNRLNHDKCIYINNYKICRCAQSSIHLCTIAFNNLSQSQCDLSPKSFKLISENIELYKSLMDKLSCYNDCLVIDLYV